LAGSLPTPGFAGEEPAAAAAAESGDQGWWHSGYLWDYGVTLASFGTYLVARHATPADEALVGPSFDPSDPEAILAPGLADRLGRRHLTKGEEETVPTSAVATAVPLTAAYLALQCAALNWMGADAGWPEVHDAALGALESAAITAAAVTALKLTFGRLRPDFQDRLRRHRCNGGGGLPPDECVGQEGRTLASDPDEAEEILEDGRRSFPSGHAATSFALATYASLLTGGQLVWGGSATPARRVTGIALQTVMLGAAGFVAASRLDDGRHHMSDVVAGAALGIGAANLVYWRHFDATGRRRDRRATGAQVSVVPSPAGVGLALLVRH
jgi:membrane-associated phospholipid phosphatase